MIHEIIGNIKNPIFFIPILSALFAQIIKGILRSLKEKRLMWNSFIEWGGMPSSHSALVVSLSLILGFKEGFNSSIFILSIFFAGIVIADAIGVRLATEEQAKVINKILKKYPINDIENTILKESIGHTFIEAIVGGILGFIVALLYLIWGMIR
jgi:acid phosphatase family membrane protein YuiD